MATPSQHTPTRHFSHGPAHSPRLGTLPSVSPAVTRLDRVLDLVTEHESKFRDQEVRVVDVSARIARVEDAVGRGTVGDFDVRAELEAAKLAVDTLNAQMLACVDDNDTIRRDVRNALSQTREDTAAAVKQLKASFKVMLDDALAKMTKQVESAKAVASERERRGGGAKEAETAALSARVDDAERVASAAAAAVAELAESSSTRGDAAGRVSLSAETCARLDAMEADREKMKRRVNKLVTFYNHGLKEYARVKDVADGKPLSGGRSPALSMPGIAENDKENADGKDNATIIARLLARVDEQSAETSELRTRFAELAARVERRPASASAAKAPSKPPRTPSTARATTTTTKTATKPSSSKSSSSKTGVGVKKKTSAAAAAAVDVSAVSAASSSDEKTPHVVAAARRAAKAAMFTPRVQPAPFTFVDASDDDVEGGGGGGVGAVPPRELDAFVERMRERVGSAEKDAAAAAAARRRRAPAVSAGKRRILSALGDAGFDSD